MLYLVYLVGEVLNELVLLVDFPVHLHQVRVQFLDLVFQSLVLAPNVLHLRVQGQKIRLKPSNGLFFALIKLHFLFQHLQLLRRLDVLLQELL